MNINNYKYKKNITFLSNIKLIENIHSIVQMEKLLLYVAFAYIPPNKDLNKILNTKKDYISTDSIFEILVSENDESLHVIKLPNIGIICNSVGSGKVVVCRDEFNPSDYELKYLSEKLIERIRIGRLHFYYKPMDSSGSCNTAYSIYKLKLYARYLYTKKIYSYKTIDIDINSVSSMIEGMFDNVYDLNNTKATSKNSIAVFKNIIYNFKDTKIMYKFINAINNKHEPLSIEEYFPQLKSILVDSLDSYNIKDTKVDIDKTLFRYITTITLYAVSQRKNNERYFVFGNSDNSFIPIVELLLLDRFLILPQKIGSFYKSLFLGTYTYIISGNTFGGVEGKFEINSEGCLIYVFAQGKIKEKKITSKSYGIDDLE